MFWKLQLPKFQQMPVKLWIYYIIGEGEGANEFLDS